MGGDPKSSILVGFAINHPFWGTPISGNHQMWFGSPFCTAKDAPTKRGRLPVPLRNRKQCVAAYRKETHLQTDHTKDTKRNSKVTPEIYQNDLSIVTFQGWTLETKNNRNGIFLCTDKILEPTAEDWAPPAHCQPTYWNSEPAIFVMFEGLGAHGSHGLLRPVLDTILISNPARRCLDLYILSSIRWTWS